MHLRNGNLFNEARLFASGVSIPVDHPRVYKSIVDWLRLDFLLVMEDLTHRGADPRDATRPMTVEQVADGLRGLARLHSRYWGFSRKTDSEAALGEDVARESGVASGLEETHSPRLVARRRQASQRSREVHER